MKSKKDYHLACKMERTATNQENNARNSTEFSADQVETCLQPTVIFSGLIVSFLAFTPVYSEAYHSS